MYAGKLDSQSPLNQQLCLLTRPLLACGLLMNIYFRVLCFFMALYKPLIYFVPVVSPDFRIDVICSFFITAFVLREREIEIEREHIDLSLIFAFVR